MCKTIKNKFDECLTFKKLLEAHDRASYGKKNKKEIIEFEIDLETNIVKLLKSIKNGKYKVGDYRTFIIYEPKERIIKSLPYKDRIVHQWYIEEFIKPYILKRFINDTYACIENRGTLKSVLKVQKYMKKMKKLYGEYYVLKCDIRKFFYSIDKKILLNILTDMISDKKIIDFTKIILGDIEEIGIPIGNYTSQYFANIYLNELDHFIKEKLKVKYVVRYMDDFIILCKTKDECKYLLNKIRKFLENNLHLELNKKTRYYKSKIGIDFCGYIIHEEYMLIRKRSKKKINKNIKIWNKKYLQQNLDIHKTRMQFNSWLAYTAHANTFNLRNKVFNNIFFKDELELLNISIE